jgi:hypothetical protein
MRDLPAASGNFILGELLFLPVLQALFLSHPLLPISKFVCSFPLNDDRYKAPQVIKSVTWHHGIALLID